MLKAIGVLVAVLVLAAFAPSASASHPRTGVLDEPLGHVIYDFFDSEKEPFFVATGTWEDWTAPEGVTFAVFELVGGAGESGEGHGHVVAGVDLEPGETYGVRVGAGGEDTSAFSLGCAIPEWWECSGTVIAAGGDSATSWNQTNLVPSDASPSDELWEGGGPSSSPQSGWAIVHYWPEEDDPPTGGEPPPTGGLADNVAVGAQALQVARAPGLVSKLCKIRWTGRRVLTWIGADGVDLGHRRAVHPRRRGACPTKRGVPAVYLP